jgi:MFS superfamily sulfate permease-like transporter
MTDLAGFRRLAAFRRWDLLLALGCLAGVPALDILYGVLVAVGLSVAELLTLVARPHDEVEGVVPGAPGRPAGLTESAGTGLIFPNLPTSVAAYREWGSAQ